MYSFPLKLIIEYLFKAHDYYINVKVPEIKSLIEKVANTEDKKTHKAVLLIQAFFDEYAVQLKKHIEREEKKIYPYILELESIYESKEANKIIEFKTKYDFSIDDYAQEHEDIEEKLYDIKNLIIKYIKPQDDYFIYFKILGQLAHLEDDINDHSEMENKVLIPRVRIMEEAIKN